MKKTLATITLALLSLTGCGTNNTAENNPSPTKTASTSPSPTTPPSTSASPTTSTTPTATQTPKPSPTSCGQQITTQDETAYYQATTTGNPDQPITWTKNCTPIETVPLEVASQYQLTQEQAEQISQESQQIVDDFYNDIASECATVDPSDQAQSDYCSMMTSELPTEDTPTETKEAPQYGYTNNELTREQCEALDPNTAMSGQLQYCFTQYGL